MPAILVQSKSNFVPNSTSVDTTLDTPATAGNTLIAVMSANRAESNIVTPTNFSELQRVGNGTGTTLVVAKKQAVGGEQTITLAASITAGGSRMVLTLLEISGADYGAITVASNPSISIGTVTTLSTPSVTAFGLFLACVGIGGASTPIGWGAWTNSFISTADTDTGVGSNNVGHSVGRKSVDPAVATSATQTWGVLAPAVATMVVIPNVATQAPVVPNPPTNVVVASPVTVGNTARVSWVHNDPNLDPQVKFRIQRKLSTSGTWTVLPEVVSSADNYNMPTTGLAAGTYNLQVATADAQGYGAYSATVNFVVQAATSGAMNVVAVPAAITLDAKPPTISADTVVSPPAARLDLLDGGEITIYTNTVTAIPAGMILDASPPTQTVYITPPQPIYTEVEFRSRYSAPQTKIIRRVEILEANGRTLWDDKVGNNSRLISGSISVDYDRDERRSTDLELANFDQALVHRPEGFWYDKILQVYRGIEFYDRSGLRYHEVPLGKFMIDRVVQPRFPNTVRITARDYTKKCLLSKFTQATAFTAGTKIEDVIAALASNAGIDERIMPATGQVLGVDTFFERGKSRWEAMKEIATPFGYELFFNAQGYLEMRKYLDPTLGPISHEFLTGPSTGNLVDWEKTTNDTRIFNHISVVGTTEAAIPVWADAYNNNLNSPTRIEKLGDRVHIIDSPLITTTAQAQELADTYLAIYALEEFEINMSSLVFPWLEAGEIIRFDDPDAPVNDPDRFLLTSLGIPLGLEPMTATGRRVTIVS